MGQLQGRQGLGLQHGVQVDVPVGPCTQEEVPAWERGRRPNDRVSVGCPGTAGACPDF